MLHLTNSWSTGRMSSRSSRTSNKTWPTWASQTGPWWRCRKEDLTQKAKASLRSALWQFWLIWLAFRITRCDKICFCCLAGYVRMLSIIVFNYCDNWHCNMYFANLFSKIGMTECQLGVPDIELRNKLKIYGWLQLIWHLLNYIFKRTTKF